MITKLVMLPSIVTQSGLTNMYGPASNVHDRAPVSTSVSDVTVKIRRHISTLTGSALVFTSSAIKNVTVRRWQQPVDLSSRVIDVSKKGDECHRPWGLGRRASRAT